MIIKKNAAEVLKQVMQQRNWHQGRIERRLAAVTKQNAIAGKLSYEKASAILQILGWQKIKEEAWQQRPVEERTKQAAAESGETHLKRVTAVTKALYEEELKKPMNKKIKFGKKIW